MMSKIKINKGIFLVRYYCFFFSHIVFLKQSENIQKYLRRGRMIVAEMKSRNVTLSEKYRFCVFLLLTLQDADH